MLPPYREAVPAPGPVRDRSPAVAPWVGAEPLWGHVVLAAAGALAVVAVAEVLLLDRVGWLTGAAFVLVCVGAALVVRTRDLFTAGVLPPLLMLVLLIAVALLDRSAFGVRALEPEASTLQVVIAGFVDESGALVVAHALTLVVVGMRVRLTRRQR